MLADAHAEAWSQYHARAAMLLSLYFASNIMVVVIAVSV